MNICKILTSAKKEQHSGTRAIFWSNRITLSSLVNYIQLQFTFFKTARLEFLWKAWWISNKWKAYTLIWVLIILCIYDNTKFSFVLLSKMLPDGLTVCINTHKTLGQYWGILAQGRGSEVCTKTTKGQYSPVRLELSSLLSSLLHGTRAILVLNFLAFKNKKYTADDRFMEMVCMAKSWPRKNQSEHSDFPCHIIIFIIAICLCIVSHWQPKLAEKQIKKKWEIKNNQP